MIRIDAEPLLSQLDGLEGLTGRSNDTLYHAIERARAAGTFTVDMADRLCVRVLGLHPCVVYGDLWWNNPLDTYAST